MRLRRREASAHGVYSNMARPEITPGLDTPVPLIAVESLNADPGINAEACPVAASFFKVPMETFKDHFDPVVRRSSGWHPPISDPGRTLEHRVGNAAEPDGDGPLDR
jgi:hypothetical protein